MALNRETIYAALLTKLQTLSATFKIISRRYIAPEDVAVTDQPSLFILQQDEDHFQSKGDPVVKSLHALLAIYCDNGEDIQNGSLPATALNNLLGVVEDCLAPDVVNNLQTLGGTVSHCYISGRVMIFEGPSSSSSIATIPIEILPGSDNNTTSRQFMFDVGYLFGVPANSTDLTPIKFGDLKDISIDVTSEFHYPSSQLQWKPNAANRLKIIKGRAKVGIIDGRILAELFFGKDLTSGGKFVQRDESRVVPDTTFQVTAVPPTGGTFVQDLGVQDGTTGLPMTKMTGSVSSGKYSVNSSGLYTFNADMVAKTVVLCYTYSKTSGNYLAISNEIKQNAPSFQVILDNQYNGKKTTWILNKCISQRFSLPATVEKFVIPEFEFEAIADLSSNVGTVNIST